jgi:beta-galactosidase
MGNSSGGMWGYWNRIYEEPHLQGGLIWDWVDQAIRPPQTRPSRDRVHPMKRGDKFFWAYGGDFGPEDVPSDDNFCCNGVVSPDRKPHPGLFEVKHIYQYIHTKPVDLAQRRVEIRNWHDFLDVADAAVGEWRLKAGGETVQRGRLPVFNLPPRATKQITVPVRPFRPAPGMEYSLEISFKLKQKQPWANAGHEIAWDEFKLPDAAPALPVVNPDRLPPLRLVSTGGVTRVSGRNFEMAFEQVSGGLVSWRYRGTELMHSPLRPDFWRAPIDNDRGRRRPEDSQAFWRTAHQNPERISFTGEERDGAIDILVEQRLPNASNSVWRTTYRIHRSGDVIVEANFTPGTQGLPRLARIGMQMTLPPGFERITWFGLGPHETYSDRSDAKTGIYSSRVEEQFVEDYVEPGETGNKVDVRWLTLRNRRGTGLLAVGMPLLSANALHYTTDDLQSAKHPFEMTRRDFITLNLDLKQQGVGGDNSWGAWPHEPFQVPSRDYQYSFRLRPFSLGENPADLARQSFTAPSAQ